MARRADALTLPQIPMGASIPRIIHQVMMQGWDALPPEIVKNIEALKARNPGWEYRFYDEPAVEAYIADHYGQGMLDLYRSIDPIYFSPRSDLFRHLVCYVEGGVYFDIKSTARQPLDEVLRPDDVFVLSQWPELADVPPEAAGTLPAAHPELAHVPGYEYVNWAIVTVPGHPFLKAVIELIVDNIQTYRPFVDGVGRHCAMRLGGPVAYTLAIHPMRETQPHRMAHLTDELDFAFSIYGDPISHRKTLGVHYSKLARPVVQKDPVTTALSLTWFGHIQPRLGGLRRRLGLR